MPSCPARRRESVAEFTFAAVIALQRRFFEARESRRAGGWEYRSFRGFELAGKTLGVVGLGRIGTRLAELASAFDMQVLAWSRGDRELPGVERLALEELLRRADVVTVNVALTDETRGLLDEQRLSLLMKPSAILVNTRAAGSSTTTLSGGGSRRAYSEGAVLDVLEREPPGPGLERLARAPNVLVTPHIAWHTDEALARQFEETTENVLAFLAGAPRNVVAGESLVV